MEVSKKRWLLLVRLGFAIRSLENELGDLTPAKLKDFLNRKLLNKGELLWQGSSGYCVLAENISSNHSGISKVYSLQSGSGFTEIQSDYVIPIRMLLSENIIPETDQFNETQKRFIRALIQTIHTKHQF